MDLPLNLLLIEISQGPQTLQNSSPGCMGVGSSDQQYQILPGVDQPVGKVPAQEACCAGHENSH